MAERAANGILPALPFPRARLPVHAWLEAPVGPPRIARQPKQGPTGLRVPPWRSEPYKSGHEVHIGRRISLKGEPITLGRLSDEPQSVPQPLHRRAGNENGAFQRVGTMTFQLV